jgi:hypothetical protein
MKSQDFPRMLYMQPGDEDIHGGKFATVIVANSDELAAAISEGWHLTTADARTQKVTPAAAPPATPATVKPLKK